MRALALLLTPLALIAQAPQPKNTPRPAAAAPSLPDPPRPVAVEQMKLANGLRVVLLSDPELPLWHGSLIVAAGSAADPPRQSGLAEITTRVILRTGTRELDPAAIDSALFRSGSQVTTASQFALSTISFHGPSAASAEVLGLLRGVVTQPLFRRRLLEDALRPEQARDATRNTNLRAVAEREFLSEFLRPAGGEGTGEPEELPVFTEDLARFHEQWWNPGNMVLVLSGDFELQAMKNKIASEWGTWRAGTGVPPARRRVAIRSSRLVLVSPENTPESSIVLGTWLDNLTLAEEAAVQIFTQLIDERIAAEKDPAKTPRIGVSAGPAGDPGRPFRIFADVRVRETIEEVKRLSKLVEELRTSAIPPQQWAAAKRTVLERFAARFDRPWKAAQFAAESLLLGRGGDFPGKFHEAVAAIAPADVSKLIKPLFAPDKLVFAIAGDERDFRDPAASLGLPVRKAALLAARPEATPLSGNAASDEKGIEALSRMREAMGGLARLEAIADAEWTYHVNFYGGAGVTLDQRVRWLRGGVIRHDERSREGATALYYDAKTAWRWRRQQKEPLPRVIANQYAGELFRTPYTLALSDRTPGRTIRYMGSGVFRVAGESGFSVEVALDEVTHLPEMFRYTSIGSAGRLAPIEERFSNYQEAGGVMVPGRIEMYESGRRIADFELTGIKFNSGLTPEELATFR